jgi:leucyl aminopeptidase
MSITTKAIAKELSELLIPSGSTVSSTPIWAVADLDSALAAGRISTVQAVWLKATGFAGYTGTFALLPGASGVAGVVFGVSDHGSMRDNPFALGMLPAVLPQGDYHFGSLPAAPELAALSWALGSYVFSRYHSTERRAPRRLVLPPEANRDRIISIATSVWLARDLINTPANDLGPAEIEDAVRHLATDHGADVKVTEGLNLISDNFPLIHAVGRASDRTPRLIDLSWGDKKAPKVTLVGKGVCFDSGGLNIKPGSSMDMMKKDMGGAAACIALASMIMAEKLPVRLRLLIPAVENSISGNAFRPSDIIRSRAGATIEIGNTDAEGRLVLADALCLADEEGPDYLFCLATLTGAARSALGPDLPPFYTDDDALAAAVAQAGSEVSDPLWRMPLWPGYDSFLKSKTADLHNIGSGSFAGSIVAALFLKKFVRKAKNFVHFDIYGWTPRALPGKPEGAEPQAARALFQMLQARFKSKTT